MYSAIASSQIQPISQRSSPLYNRKGSHKAWYQLSVSCYIQIFSWEQYLTTHAELNFNLVLIIIIFLPGMSFDQICFGLLYDILNFRKPRLSSLNQMQTINQINWSSQYLTKHHFCRLSSLLSCALALIANSTKGISSTHLLYSRLNSINKHLKVCSIVQCALST